MKCIASFGGNYEQHLLCGNSTNLKPGIAFGITWIQNNCIWELVCISVTEIEKMSLRLPKIDELLLWIIDECYYHS